MPGNPTEARTLTIYSHDLGYRSYGDESGGYFSSIDDGESLTSAQRIARKLQDLSGVEAIALNGLPWNNETIAAVISACKTNPQLRKLSINYSSVTTTDMQLIVDALRENAGIRELELIGGEIYPPALQILTDALKDNVPLQSLKLDFNDDHDISPFVEIVRANTHLKSLYLGKGKTTEDSLAALAEAIKTNRSLVEFRLGSSNFGDKGAAALAAALKNHPTLSRIALGWHGGRSNASYKSPGMRAFAELVKTNRNLVELQITDYAAECTRTAGVLEKSFASISHPRNLCMAKTAEADLKDLTAVCKSNQEIVQRLAQTAMDDASSLTAQDYRQICERLPAIHHALRHTFGLSFDAADAVTDHLRLAAEEYGIDLETLTAPRVDFSNITSLEQLRRVPFLRKLDRSAPALPVLYDAIAAGQFEEILALAQRTNERLEFTDYIIGEKEGIPSVIELLTRQGYLPQVFAQENWYDADMAGMPLTASHVPPNYLEKQLGESFGALHDRVIAEKLEWIHAIMPPSEVKAEAPPADPMPHSGASDEDLKGEADKFRDTPGAFWLEHAGRDYVERLEWRIREQARQIQALTGQVAEKTEALETRRPTGPRLWSEQVEARRAAAASHAGRADNSVPELVRN